MTKIQKSVIFGLKGFFFSFHDTFFSHCGLKHSISWSFLVKRANLQTRVSIRLVWRDENIRRCHFWIQNSFSVSISTIPNFKTTRDSTLGLKAFESLKFSPPVSQFLNRKLDVFSLETRKYMEVSILV